MNNLRMMPEAAQRLTSHRDDHSTQPMPTGQPAFPGVSAPSARLVRIAARLAVPTDDRLRRISHLLGDEQADA